MKEQLSYKRDESLPPGWPPGIQLPTPEEAEETVRKIGRVINQSRRRTKARQPYFDIDTEKTTITI